MPPPCAAMPLPRSLVIAIAVLFCAGKCEFALTAHGSVSLAVSPRGNSAASVLRPRILAESSVLQKDSQQNPIPAAVEATKEEPDTPAFGNFANEVTENAHLHSALPPAATDLVDKAGNVIVAAKKYAGLLAKQREAVAGSNKQVKGLRKDVKALVQKSSEKVIESYTALGKAVRQEKQVQKQAHNPELEWKPSALERMAVLKHTSERSSSAVATTGGGGVNELVQMAKQVAQNSQTKEAELQSFKARIEMLEAVVKSEHTKRIAAEAVDRGRNT